MDEILRTIVGLWRRQLRFAAEEKARKFGNVAKNLWRFLGQSYRQLYIDTSDDPGWDAEFHMPHAESFCYKPRMNLSAKFVATMTPYVLARVSHRQVTPRRPPLPKPLAAYAQMRAKLDQEDEVRAWLLEWWLNYLPGLYGLAGEQESALPEALVKGRAVTWCEMFEGPHGDVPGHSQDSVDNLLIDGDTVKVKDAGWVARFRRRPVWQVADDFGLPASELRGQYQSRYEQARREGIASPTASSPGSENDSNDVCEYWEIWSRAGIGQHFFDSEERLKPAKEALDSLGSNIYLAVMDNLDYPLNLPKVALEEGTTAEIKSRLQWDIPFFLDKENPWPCSLLDFLPASESPWPRSPLEAALPLQVFIDHLWSFVMGKIRRNSRDLVITSKQLSQRIQKGLVNAVDMEILEYDGAAIELQRLLHVVQFPEMQKDIWRVIPMAERAFEEMTRMDPLLRGQVGSTQPRSASEMQIREQRVSAGPDDYADKVEAWNSVMASKEAMASRTYVGIETVAPVLGEELPADFDPKMPEMEKLGPISQLWLYLVFTNDPARAISEMAYSIEAGSGRRKNQQKATADMQSIGQLVTPLLTEYMRMTGNTSPVNAWMQMVGKTLDTDVSGFMLPPIPMLPPGQEEGPQTKNE
uniref:Uncharacterized protein n=1 Tax=viral metagenome TaxID=1070528 RepID=A0A6H1ZNE1_9ZZZZ